MYQYILLSTISLKKYFSHYKESFCGKDVSYSEQAQFEEFDEILQQFLMAATNTTAKIS